MPDFIKQVARVNTDNGSIKISSIEDDHYHVEIFSAISGLINKVDLSHQQLTYLTEVCAKVRDNVQVEIGLFLKTPKDSIQI